VLTPGRATLGIQQALRAGTDDRKCRKASAVRSGLRITASKSRAMVCVSRAGGLRLAGRKYPGIQGDEVVQEAHAAAPRRHAMRRRVCSCDK